MAQDVLGFGTKATKKNPKAVVSSRGTQSDIDSIKSNAGVLGDVIGQGADASYKQFSQRRDNLAKQVAQQRQQQQQNKIEQQKQAKQNAYQRAFGLAKDVGNAMIAGERTAATGIARVLPGGTADIQAEQKRTESSARDVKYIKDLQKSGKISAPGATKIINAKSKESTQASKDTSSTVNAMPSKRQLAAGFASTGLDIVTAGSLKAGKTGLTSAKELAPIVKGSGAVPKVIRGGGTAAGFAAAGGANAASAGGDKKTVVENAAAGALMPGALKVLGMGVSKGASKARDLVPLGRGSTNPEKLAAIKNVTDSPAMKELTDQKAKLEQMKAEQPHQASTIDPIIQQADAKIAEVQKAEQAAAKTAEKAKVNQTKSSPELSHVTDEQGALGILKTGNIKTSAAPIEGFEGKKGVSVGTSDSARAYAHPGKNNVEFVIDHSKVKKGAEYYGDEANLPNDVPLEAVKEVRVGTPELAAKFEAKGIKTTVDPKLNETPKTNNAFGTNDKYVYHTDATNAPVDSFKKSGISASKTGYNGRGAYLANTPDNTLGYTVSKHGEGTLYRVDKQGLIDKYGIYSKENPKGIEFDEQTGEIVVPSNVPPELISVKQGNKWVPLAKERAKTPQRKQPVRTVMDKPTPEPKQPEIKTSKLASSTERKAIDAKLTKGFEGKPEYAKVSVPEQTKAALELLSTDAERAKRIALGHEMPPEGLLPESVYVAVEEQALKNGDVPLLRELATSSSLTSEATGMGQRLRMLAEREPDSAVTKIRELAEVRKKAAEARLKQPVEKAIKKDVSVIKSKIKSPTKTEWASFIEGIKCQYG